MMTKSSRFAVLVITIFLLVNPAFGGEPSFRITSPRNGAAISDLRFGLIALDLQLEVSKDDIKKHEVLLRAFDGNQFSISVNQRAEKIKWLGGGSGSTDSTVSQSATVAVQAGSRPGQRIITVTLGKLRRRVSVDYRPTPVLLPLRFSDNQAFLGMTDLTCTILAAHVKRNSIVITVNDKPVQPVLQDIGRQNALTLARIDAKAAGLRRGPNTIVAMARGVDNSLIDAVFVIHYYPENRVPVGAEFLYYVGYPGSKSGPFFNCIVEGDGLKSHGTSQGPSRAESFDELGFLMEEPPLLAKISAVAPGAARITIWEKPHFLESNKVKESIAISIFDPLEPKAVASDDAGETFVADGGAFRCRTPEGWSTISEGADDADGVFGVTAIGPPVEIGLHPTIKVEYFSDGNSLHSTPQKFMQVITSTMFDSEGETTSAISVVEINGRKGWSFDQVDFEYIPPNALHPKIVRTIEKYVIFPETNTSFYVLRLTAPEEVVAACDPIYRSVVQSFEPRALTRPAGQSR